MIELFENVSQNIKNQIKFWVDSSLNILDAPSAAKLLIKYRSFLKEEEQDFFDFYFNLKRLEMKGELDESNSN